MVAEGVRQALVIKNWATVMRGSKANADQPINVLELLAGGDRRSLGRSDEVVAMVSANPSLLPQLMEGLWSEDPVVRMRAADAIEKVTRDARELFQDFKAALLGLMAETTQKEVRWHLALMVPLLRLSARERDRAVSLLKGYLADDSSIVKTFALQGLADLARGCPELQAKIVEILREATRKGTAAMKARSRRLLTQL